MIKNKELEESKRREEEEELKKKNEITGVIEPSKSAKNEKNKDEFSGVIRGAPKFEDDADYLLYNINHYTLLVNKLDNYGNSIPLGAFCYALSFIMYGFYECKVHKKKDKFLDLILLLFGGIGQIIAGLLEYIKGRTYPSNLYLLYGIYFISFYYAAEYFEKNANTIHNCKKFFFGSWAGLTFPLFVGSFQTNLFYSFQTLTGCGFFIIRCVGECEEIKSLNETVSGILEIVTGVVSLYICFNQIINQTFRFQLLPSLNFQKDNEIDLDKNENKKK